MHQLTPEIEKLLEQRLNSAQPPAAHRPAYVRWLRLFFLFRDKFGYSPGALTSLGPFLTKLAESNQSIQGRAA